VPITPDNLPDDPAALKRIIAAMAQDALTAQAEIARLKIPVGALSAGRVRPFDFAVTSLRLIVEVKVVRASGDVDDLEAQIADDLSLYFKPTNPFDSMIVYVYDDRDSPESEKYPAISDALKRRSERITNVVIVRRPSMIPGDGSACASSIRFSIDG